MHLQKTMLGICSRKPITGNKTSPRIHKAGVVSYLALVRVDCFYFSTYRWRYSCGENDSEIWEMNKFCTTRMSNSLKQVNIHILWLIFAYRKYRGMLFQSAIANGGSGPHSSRAQDLLWRWLSLFWSHSSFISQLIWPHITKVHWSNNNQGTF